MQSETEIKTHDTNHIFQALNCDASGTYVTTITYSKHYKQKKHVPHENFLHFHEEIDTCASSRISNSLNKFKKKQETAK